jgi:hypothetical protein
VNVAEVIIRVVELFEAEGRCLRRHVLRLVMAVAGFGVIAALLLGGVVMLFVSVYLRVRASEGDATAALVTGLCSLTVAIIGSLGAWIWVNHKN